MEQKDLPVIDWELGMKLAGNKQDLARDMILLLIRDLPGETQAILQLHADGNYDQLQNRIHKLHGAVSYCGTPRLKHILVLLETQLKNHIMDSVPSLLKQFETEVTLLLEHPSIQ